MKILIDLQGAQGASRYRGIGRYSLALAEAMCRNSDEDEIHIALNGAYEDTIMPLRATFSALIPEDQIHVWSAPGPTALIDPANHDRHKRAKILYETFLASLEPDFIYISSVFEGTADHGVVCIKELQKQIPVAATLYDLIPLKDPSYLQSFAEQEALYGEQIESLKSADLLLPISEFSAREAHDLLIIPQEQLATIWAGYSSVFKPSRLDPRVRKSVRAQYGLEQPFLIAVGTIEPRKNLDLLFKAFAQLPKDLKSSHKIAIAGNMDQAQRKELLNRASQCGLLECDLKFTGYVSDEDLTTLYTEASLMVFPSLDEGFGLPPLEAMACGTPTIAANAASLPEVMGDALALFDPKDPTALASLIESALNDASFAGRLRKNAATQSAKFSWDRSAKLALEAIRKRHEDLLSASSTEYQLDRENTPTSRQPYEELAIETLRRDLPSDQAETVKLATCLNQNFPDKLQKRRLFVDITELAKEDSKTGIQRVVRSILNELLSRPLPTLEVVPVYAHPDRFGYISARNFAAPFGDKSHKSEDEIVDFRPQDIFFALDLSHLNLPQQKPFLHALRRRGVRVICMVYDLLPIEIPKHFVPDFNTQFEVWLSTVAEMDGIIGISQATVDSFLRWYETGSRERQGNPIKTTAVHLGADLSRSKPTYGIPDESQQVLETMKARPTFLMAGTVEPRKGHKLSLDAFEHLWKQSIDANLVIVGKLGWATENLAKQIRTSPYYEKKLFWLDAASDEYLELLYKSATCLLVASEGEGFGLPLIEGAQNGLPLLVRNLPVFKEIAGEHATYFESGTATQLADSVKDWLIQHEQGKVIGSEDMTWLTWAESAEQVLDILLKW